MPQIVNEKLAETGRITDHILLDTAGHLTSDLDVILIQPCTANNLLFSSPVLERAAPLFQGAPVFVDHPLPGEALRPGGRSVRDLAGLISNPTWDTTLPAITAKLRLASTATWLQQLINEFADLPHIFGLSPDIWLQREDDRTGSPAVVLAITSVNSVDIVIRPSAGGRFIPPAKGASMAAQLAQANDPQGVTQRAQTAHTDPPNPSAPTAQPDPAPVAPQGQGPAQAVPLADAIELLFASTDLPEPLRAIVRADKSLTTLPQAQARVAELKAAWASAIPATQVIQNLGTITSGKTGLDRITLAFERLMGLPMTADHRAVRPLSGIREMYDTLTGDWERHGIYRPDRVQFANATTDTMASVVANVLNKVMLQAFEARPQWWAPIVHEEDFTNLNDTKWLTIAGFDDLDTVAEGDPYTEVTWEDYAETWPFIKKGNYLGLTLEMIDRDDVGAVRRLPRALGYAAWRTLSSAVSSLFTANAGVGPALADTNPLFHAAHNNVGSSALADTSWHATVTAMFQQQELGSGKRLGIRPQYLLVPIELEQTAIEIFTTDLWPGRAGNDRAIELVTKRVITVPDWDDPTDWAAAADPRDLPGVVIGYRFGRAPELFVADHPLTGSMFTNDEMRIKVRFLYAIGVGDFRALYKHNVADG